MTPSDRPTIDGGASSGDTRRSHDSWWRSADFFLGLAVVAATTPILVAAGRGVGRGWLPVADDAYTAIRGRDVLGGSMPMLGAWSSGSFWAHRQINHPGPLQFDAAAFPIRLLGPGAGVAFATAGVNVAAIITVAWLSRRLLGPLGATMTMLFTAGLVWAIGSEVLYDPWAIYAPLLPFLAFLFAVWAVASGRATAWPVLAIAGSYAVQTHLSYVLLVPGLGAWAVAAWLLALRRSKREQPRDVDHRRRQLVWALAGIGTLLVCWAQPLYQQLSAEQGNLSALVSSGAKAPHGPGPRGALQAVGNIVGIPPFWLPPTWASPPFRFDGTGRPLALLAAALAALTIGGAVLAWLAFRADDHIAMTGLVTAALAVALGFASAAKATSPFGLVATYVRWLWPISMFAWTVLIVAAVRTVRRTDRAHFRQRLPQALGPALAGLAVVTALLAIPTADHGTAAPRWAMPVTRKLSAQAIPRIGSRGPVLVRLEPSFPVFAVGPALLFELQRHGIDFVVDEKSLVAQLGTERRFDGANARTTLTVVGGDAAAHPPEGARRIAYAPALDPAERRIMLRLGLQVESRLRALHHTPLNRSALDRSPAPGSAMKTARRAEQGDQAALGNLVRQGLVDNRAFGRVDIRRWADLSGRWQNETVAVLAGRAPRTNNARPAP